MIPAMTTDRLMLREYNDADINDYFRLKSDKETMYYLQDIQLFSQEEADADLAKILVDMMSENRKFYFFHVELKETYEQDGSVGYWHICGSEAGPAG